MKKTLFYYFFSISSIYAGIEHPPQRVFEGAPPLFFGQSIIEVQKAFQTEPVDMIPPRDIGARKGVDKRITFKNIRLEFDSGLLHLIEINKPFKNFCNINFFHEEWRRFTDRNGQSIIKPGITKSEIESCLADWISFARDRGIREASSHDTTQSNCFVMRKKNDDFINSITISFSPFRRTKGGRGIWCDGIIFSFASKFDVELDGVAIDTLERITIFCDKFNTRGR